MSQVIAASCAQKLVPALVCSRRQPHDCVSGIFSAKNVLPLEMERAGNNSHEAADRNVCERQRIPARPTFEQMQMQAYSSKSIEDIERWLESSCESFASDCLKTKDDRSILPRYLHSNPTGNYSRSDSSANEDISNEETSISSEKENESGIQSWHLESLDHSTRMIYDIDGSNVLIGSQVIEEMANEIKAVDGNYRDNQDQNEIDSNWIQYPFNEIDHTDVSTNTNDQNPTLENSQNLLKSTIVNSDLKYAKKFDDDSEYIDSVEPIQTTLQTSCIKNKSSKSHLTPLLPKSRNEPNIRVRIKLSKIRGSSQQWRQACALMPLNSINRGIDLQETLTRVEKVNVQNRNVRNKGSKSIQEAIGLDLDNRNSDITNILEEAGVTNVILKNFKKRSQSSQWHCYLRECDRRFSKLCDLKTHLLSHMGVKPFKCDHVGCSWAFYTEFKLKRHKETHLKKKDFQCLVPGCGRRFTTIYNLTSHQKLHSRPESLACEVAGCNAKFQTKRASELHMKTHDASFAPYVCEFENCGKRFYTNNTLTSHQRSHTHSQSDLICSWQGCGKIFDLPCRLKTHMRSHTGTKPYVCTFKGCKWAFSTSSKLSRHQRKHTNDRKFVCDVNECRKAFMRPDHLKEHKLTHSLRRLFQCHLCPSAFNAKSSLYVHLKKHKNKEFSYNSHQQSKNKDVSKKSISNMREVPCSRVQPIRSSRHKAREQKCTNKTSVTVEHQTQAIRERDRSPCAVISFDNEAEEKILQHDSCLHHSRTRTNESEMIDKVSEQYVLWPAKIFNSSMNGFCERVLTKSEGGGIKAENHSTIQTNLLREIHGQKREKQRKGSVFSLFDSDVQRDRVDLQYSILNGGSARTSFTKEMIIDLKRSRISPVPTVQDRGDVFNDTHVKEFSESTDDLPSMCCPSDIEIPESQILLLNLNPDNDFNSPELEFPTLQTNVFVYDN